MKKVRVAIVHNIPTPYRTVLFNTIAEHPEIDLHVFYCAERHENRNWSLSEGVSHDYTVLPGLSLDRSGIHYHVNPSVASRLLSGEFDVAVIGGETNFTMQLGYVSSKLGLDGTVLWTERFREPKRLIGKPLGPVTRVMAQQADVLVVPTAQAKRFQRSRGVPPDQIVVAPNVVDNSSYYSDERDGESLRLLFVGQLIDRKGITTLIDAYERLDRSNVELLLVGDGPKREHYERIVSERGLDVTFTGWVSEEKKRRYLATGDCFVLPSREDLAPLVLHEAMAAGLPIVTTDGVGNAPEMVTNGGNGQVIPAGDVSELADALSGMLASETSLEQMGHRSQRVAEELFSPNRATQQFLRAVRMARS